MNGDSPSSPADLNILLVAVLSGSEDALSDAFGSQDVQSSLEMMAGALEVCLRLRWPQGATGEVLAEYARRPEIYDEEAAVSPMITEAVLRAAAGDARFIQDLDGEMITQHLAVALRLLLADLKNRGMDTADVATAAMVKIPGAGGRV